MHTKINLINNFSCLHQLFIIKLFIWWKFISVHTYIFSPWDLFFTLGSEQNTYSLGGGLMVSCIPDRGFLLNQQCYHTLQQSKIIDMPVLSNIVVLLYFCKHIFFTVKVD